MMGRNLGVALVMLTLLATPRFSATEGNQFTGTFEVTDAGLPLAFGFVAGQVLVANDGAQTVYINFAGNTPDIQGFKLKPGESVAVGPTADVPGRSGIGLICASEQTSIVRVLAL